MKNEEPMKKKTKETTSDNEKSQKRPEGQPRPAGAGPGGRFVKGQPRPAGAGRKPGSRNKLTRTIKAVIEATFHDLQRDQKRNLLAWAMKSNANLREFYKMAARFIPIEARVSADLNVQEPPSFLEVGRRLAHVLRMAAMEADATDIARLSAPSGQGGKPDLSYVEAATSHEVRNEVQNDTPAEAPAEVEVLPPEEDRDQADAHWDRSLKAQRGAMEGGGSRFLPAVLGRTPYSSRRRR